MPTQTSTINQVMARIIMHQTAGAEECCTAIPNLFLFRRSTPTEPAACLIEPAIVFVVQGEKQITVGQAVFPYDPTNFLVSSVDLPAISQVVMASAELPCLGMVLKLDLRVMAEVIAQSSMRPALERSSERGIGRGILSAQLLDPFMRLLALLEEPASISMLSPLIEREIYFRLLQSDQAARLWQIASMGSQSQSQRIAKAIDWLKTNYAAPLRVDELADHIQMSPSSFHAHFRQITTMSPLQYQKWLRLNEARRLMLGEHMDAANAAFQVGYESPSQFSREYSRMFGAPPKRDIENLIHRRADNPGLLA